MLPTLEFNLPATRLLLGSPDMSLRGKIDPAIARHLAEQIRAIGKSAKTEEDVRLNVEGALKHHLAQLGISTTASYEQPITLLQGSGSADAVYGFGIIEYKRPGVIATPSWAKVHRRATCFLPGRQSPRARPHKAA